MTRLFHYQLFISPRREQSGDISCPKRVICLVALCATFCLLNFGVCYGREAPVKTTPSLLFFSEVAGKKCCLLCWGTKVSIFLIKPHKAPLSVVCICMMFNIFMLTSQSPWMVRWRVFGVQMIWPLAMSVKCFNL